MSGRSRNWVFTLNNYNDNDIVTLTAFATTVRYLTWGKELAGTTGTPHLQGFVIFRDGKTVATARRLLVGCHVESARGSPDQCRTYCHKDGDFVEFGTPPVTPVERGNREVARYHTAWDFARDGDLESIDADIRIRCYATLKRIRVDYKPLPEPLTGVCGVWIWGLAGCGKTTSVFSKWPGCFSKPLNKWWDGYADEDVVLYDDVSIYHRELGTQLKHCADFAPFSVEKKGSQEKIRPKRVVVTSQYTIEQIWEDEETRDALNRRFISINKIKGQDIILL